MLPTLETERLSLRPVTLAIVQALLDDDAAAFRREIGADYPENAPLPPLMDDFLEYLLVWMQEHPAEEAWTWFGIDRARSAAVVSGGLGLGPDSGRVAMLGYSTYPSEEGRGYASEFAMALVQWALEQGGLSSVEATIPPDHLASIRVAERAGLTRRGTAVDAEVGEVLVYGRDR